MYHQKYRHFSNRRSGRVHRVKSFNPTHLIQKATASVAKEEYIAKNSFSDFAIDVHILKNVMARGYKNPTPIQDQAIPELLNGRDLIGIADTGTGKTAAFLIPLIDKILKNPKEKVLIVAPIRELASQIESELRIFAGGTNIHTALVVGGMPIFRQVNDLRRKPGFVIGTPGRLKDLEKRREIDFRSFNTIVLDEVDRMLDMGFLREIEQIISQLPDTRQSVFFSATITPDIGRIAERLVRNAITIRVESRNTLTNINQDVVRVNGKSKINVLKDMLGKAEFKKVLVFGRTKRNVQNLEKDLKDSGIWASCIHGNKSQSQRFRTLNDFKSGRIKVLIATDVASRGIDVEDISHVINYDLPESHEVYIHRIGRTGRANKTGHALSFVE